MKTLRTSLLFIALSGIFFSCVPSRKYQEVKQREQEYREQLRALKTKSRTCFSRNSELEAEIIETKRVSTILARDTALLGASYRQMKVQYDKINALNNEILRKLSLLQNQAENESRDLNRANEQAKLDLQSKEDKLRSLESSLSKLRQDLYAKEDALKDREQRVRELEDIIATKDASVKALKDKITKSLLGFADKGLSVTQKNGKVYVSMAAKLLFPSGSIEVDPVGEKALVKLAKALEGKEDLEIVVEGHTDTDRLKSRSHPKDNWELSVLRATSVVKILIDNSKIYPKTLSACGRSEFIPISQVDKSKNRRIEVILTPNLDELYKVLKSN